MTEPPSPRTGALRPARGWPAGIVAAVAFTLLIAALDRSIGITFETNSDVAMMMIAHGFGIAAMPTPVLPFSNVVQGQIV